MKIYNYKDIDLKEIVRRSEDDVTNVIPIVSDILEDIKLNKDDAVKKYTEKFDKVKIDNLKVTDKEIKESYENLDDKLIEALRKASLNIQKFHKKEIPEEWEIEISPGVKGGQIIRPLNIVGCYIPGGRAPYPSTILMTIIPAKIAGVEKVIACTPPQANGKVADAILVAADIAGADEIYKVGGSQAIGAMAYGTESVPKVEKVVGPGNIFVTAAKKLVYGDIDIEFPAGPSEVLIIADDTADPEFIGYDILSQGEHDPNASCFLVTTSKQIATKSLKEIKEKTEVSKRKEVIEESLLKYGKIILTENLDEAIEVSNEYAPEHLIIATKENEKVLKKIKNAGSIFLGNYSPVACGDYGSGTNHVLPTAGGARMYSGLSTEDFLKKPTVQTITKEGLEKLADTCIPIAEYEGFYAHADSIKSRLKK